MTLENRSSAPDVQCDVDDAARASFWKRVDARHQGCWKWLGYISPQGYGQLHIQGKTEGAHRFAFYLSSVDPKGFHVCHKCDNPPCCNPAHLFLGDPLDNAADMVAKGRHRGNGGGPRRTRAPSYMPRRNSRGPTSRQVELLRAFSDFVAKNEVAPTLRELTVLLGNASTNGVVDILKSLEAKSLVEHRPFARGYRITEAGRRALDEAGAP